jgi:hypothetical protein
MKYRPHRAVTRSIGIMLFMALIPVGMILYGVNRERRQQRLNAQLIAAVKQRDTNAVVTLLQHGADANASDRPVVVTGFWTTVLRVLHRLPSVPRFPNALHLALDPHETAPDMEIVNALLKYGADVNVPDDDGATVLMRALRGGSVDLVNALLHHTPNLGLHDKNNDSALAYAIRSGDIALVRRVLDAGASIQDRCGESHDPITFAVFSRGTGTGRIQPLSMVDLLLDRGVDINARDSDGETLLISAAELGDDELLGDLLKRGANVNLKMNGETALDRVHDAMKDTQDPYYSLNALKKVEAMLKNAGAK